MKISVPAHHSSCVRKVEDDGASIEFTCGMGSEKESRNDTEVAATPTKCPEKLVFSTFAGNDKAAVGKHDISLDQAIDSQAILPAQIAVSTAQRQPPSHPGGRDDPEWNCLSERVSGVVDFACCTPWLHTHRAVHWIDAHPLQSRQIDHQTLVDAAKPGAVVTAATYSDRNCVATPKIHSCNDIGRICAAGNDKRPLVDHAVVELSGLLIARITRTDNLSSKRRQKLGYVDIADDIAPSLDDPESCP